MMADLFFLYSPAVLLFVLAVVVYVKARSFPFVQKCVYTCGSSGKSSDDDQVASID